ncbi:hypothetical protein PLESTB_000932500 [Pleodorina starrii]|uniref:Toprim domain-containing protein n=1 Tax=Pleodorina starrii TaxID=330485 RepID=A0A9W6BPC5_9CHLO|nr:hypothetical protein PLESTM_001552700 [Pleodorina starrii]GLC55026.1 hypothetical protein PLESTB_000932500 [Pleodorina starrii]GLC68408.1 hypothetical protein PLESTF_000688300 [Pleodorina starrii]
MRSAAGAWPHSHFGRAARELSTCRTKSALGARVFPCIEACDRREGTARTRGNARNPERNPVQPVQPRIIQSRTNYRSAGLPSRPAGSQHEGRRGAQPAPAGVDIANIKKRLVAPPNNDQLPRLDALIIVEGYNDCIAVHRAIRSPVYVLGGGYALAEEMKPELRYVAQLAASGELPRQIVVFTDPDWQGRMFRTYLDDLLPQPCPPAPGHSQGQRQQQQQQQQQRPGAEARSETPGNKGLVVRHAFLRVELGTSEEASRYHEAGNVGVEHATPDTIRKCLVRARPGFGPERTEFSVEQLRADGLVGSWDDKSRVAGPQLRRGRFCAALGIDEVGTGKALVNLLNRFFTREEYQAALAVAAGPAP